MGLRPYIDKPRWPDNRQSPSGSGRLKVYSFWLLVVCRWDEIPNKNHAGDRREHKRLLSDSGARPSPD